MSKLIFELPDYELENLFSILIFCEKNHPDHTFRKDARRIYDLIFNPQMNLKLFKGNLHPDGLSSLDANGKSVIK